MDFYRTALKFEGMTKGISHFVRLPLYVHKLEPVRLHLLNLPGLPVRKMWRRILQQITQRMRDLCAGRNLYRTARTTIPALPPSRQPAIPDRSRSIGSRAVGASCSSTPLASIRSLSRSITLVGLLLLLG